MMWDCHVDDSAKGRYYMILGIYILISLGLNLKIPNTSYKPMAGL